MGIASDQEFMSNSLVVGLIAAGSSWYLSDVPPDATTSIWPSAVAGFVFLVNLIVWAFPATYTDSDRHPILYGCFGGIPLLLASWGLHETAYSTLSLIYLWAGVIILALGASVSLFHLVRQKSCR